MNVSLLSNSMSSVSSTYAAQGTASVQSDTSDDGTGQVHGHRGHGHGHGGGPMQDALTSALDSIGLTVPSGATQPPPPPGGASGMDDGSSTDGSSGSDSTIQSDMKQFMQALAQAVQGESSSSGTSSSSSGSTDPRTSFASGLSALLTQVAGGDAPQSLQDAFTKLATDLTSADAGSTASSASSSTTTSSQPSLQALLTQLQQNFGYSASSSGSGSTQAVGSLFSAQV